METMLVSTPQGIRSKMATIEAVELTVLGFLFWFLIAMVNKSNASFGELLLYFIFTEGILFGTWGIYNAYIRIARAGGRFIDIMIWVIAAMVTGSFTFWTWIILDVKRILMSKLFYRGDAPVEYAWSAHSKYMRKMWEQARKEGLV